MDKSRILKCGNKIQERTLPYPIETNQIVIQHIVKMMI